MKRQIIYSFIIGFHFFQAILESQAPESAQKNINLKILSELKVIVPEKEKQNEFVDFVDQVNKSKFINQLLQKMELYMSRYNRESEIKQKKCF